MSADQSGDMVDYGLGDPSGTEGGKAMCGDNGVQALFYAAYIVRDRRQRMREQGSRSSKVKQAALN
eukprot:COSAG06_NODE_19108_length_853_cov_0.935013_1_plen_66_part_00